MSENSTNLFNRWRDLSHTYSRHILSRKLKVFQQSNPSAWAELIKDLKTSREIDDKLVAEGFDPGKTESQIMAERGFNKVYDCGNLVYVWHRN